MAWLLPPCCKRRHSELLVHFETAEPVWSWAAGSSSTGIVSTIEGYAPLCGKFHWLPIIDGVYIETGPMNSW